MRKITGVLMLLLITSAVAFAQAEFTAVNGKVEVRPGGSGSWQAAQVGMTVRTDTLISTGFNASAEIEVSGSTVEVQQLTRMAFEEIVAESDDVQTSVSLNVGRVRAEVRSTEGRSQNFEVRSPVSTASVRGTTFEMGVGILETIEGAVSHIDRDTARSLLVAAGQRSRASTRGLSSPSNEAESSSSTSISPIGAGSDDDAEADATGAPGVIPGGTETTGSVVIEIR
jgi:hypothetical protein